MRCRYCSFSNTEGEWFCSACGSPLQESAAQPAQKKDMAAITEIQCPHCGNSHPSTIWNCPLTGAELSKEPVMEAPSHNSSARLTMDNGNEIILASSRKSIGRDDFDRILSAEDLPYISRQHLIISTEDGNYYIEDTCSKNGTCLNNHEIRQAGRKALKDGDRIELGKVITLTFKTL